MAHSRMFDRNRRALDGKPLLVVAFDKERSNLASRLPAAHWEAEIKRLEALRTRGRIVVQAGDTWVRLTSALAEAKAHLSAAHSLMQS